MQTIFNTPKSEYENKPRIERLVLLRNSIIDLMNDGVKLPKTLSNIEHEIAIEHESMK